MANRELLIQLLKNGKGRVVSELLDFVDQNLVLLLANRYNDWHVCSAVLSRHSRHPVSDKTLYQVFNHSIACGKTDMVKLLFAFNIFPEPNYEAVQRAFERGHKHVLLYIATLCPSSCLH